MPYANVPLTNGESIEFYVPEGTTPEQATALAPRKWADQNLGLDILAPPPEPERTLFGLGEEGLGYTGEVGAGLASGALGLIGSALTGASFLLPEEQEQAAREAIQRGTEAAQAPFAPKRGYEDTITRMLSEGLGSTAPFLATGFFGIPGILGGLGMGAAAQSGEAAQRATAEGATEEQISEAAGLGVIPGLGEMLVPYGIGKSYQRFRKLKDAVGVEEATNIVSRLGRIGAAAGSEGLQEASAEVAQNLIAQGVYDPETGTFANTKESFGLGAGVGGLLQGLMELAIRRPRGGGGVQEQEETLALPAPPLALPAPEAETLALPAPPLRLPPPASYIPPSAFPIGVSGVVVNNAQEYAARVQELRDQQQTETDIANSIRWNDPATERIVAESMALNAPPVSGMQGELFGPAPAAPTPQEGLRPEEQDMQERLLAAELQPQEQLTIEDAIRESEIAQAYDEQAQADAAVAAAAGQTGPQTPTAMAAALTPIAEQLFGSDAQNRVSEVAERVDVEGGLSGNIGGFEAAMDRQEEQIDTDAGRPPTPARQKDETFVVTDEERKIERKKGEAAAIQEEVQTLMDVQLRDKDDVDKFKINQTTMVEAAIPVMQEDADALNKLTKPKTVRVAGPKRAAHLYGRAYNQLDLPPQDIANVTIRAIAADAALNDAGLSDSEIDNVLDIRKRMENGANAGRWIEENLSPEAVAAFNEQRKTFAEEFRRGEASILRNMNTEAMWERRYAKIQKWKPEEAKRLKAKEKKLGRDNEEFIQDFEAVLEKRRTPKSVLEEAEEDIADEKRQIKRDTKLAKAATLGAGTFAKKLRGKEQTEERVKWQKKLELAQTRLNKAQEQTGNQYDPTKIAKAEKDIREAKETLKALEDSPEILTSAERQRRYEEIKAANLEQYEVLEGIKKKHGSDSREFIVAFDIAYQNYLGNLSGSQLEALANYEGDGGTVTQFAAQEGDRGVMGSRQRLWRQGNLYLPKHAIEATMEKVPRRIENAVSNGRIKRVYELLAESKNPLVARVARGILQNLGTTKISRSTNFIGADTAGAFDPRANTIYINTEGDVSVHTLLHEGVHAVTSHVIDENPNAPAVQELQKIYDNTQDALSSAYGAESLHEFVAEFMTNPRFRAEVSSIPYQTVKGEPVSVGLKIRDAIRRIINRFILRKPHQKIMGRAVSQIDSLIDSIMSPAPVSRDAPVMRMTFKELQKDIDQLGKQAGLGKLTGGQRKESIELTKNYAKSAPSKARQLLNSFMPLNVLVEMYRNDFDQGPEGKRTNALEDLFIKIKEKVGKRQKRLAAIKDTGNELRRLIPKEATRRKMFDFMSDSTLDRIDGSLPRDHYTKYWASWEESTGKVRKDKDGNKLGVIYKEKRQSFNTPEEREAFILNNKLSNKEVRVGERELNKAKKANDTKGILAAQQKIDAAKAATANIRGLQRWGGWKAGGTKLAKYDKLRRRWESFNNKDGTESNAQRAYKLLRDSHKKQLDDTLEAMDDRLAAYTTNLLERKTMGDKIFELMRGKERIEPYFPLYREGKEWLTYKLKNDTEPRKMLFKDKEQRQWYIDKLKATGLLDTAWEKTGYTVGSQREGEARKSKIDNLSTGTAYAVMQQLKKAKAPAPVQNEVLEALLNSMPEQALAQIFRTREGTLGFETDHFAVFEKAMPSRVMQLLNLEYDVPIDIINNRIKKRVGELNNPAIDTFYEETIKGYITFVKNPDIATWAKMLKSAGFAATLGVNVSSVLVNATNLPIVVFPYLGGKYGYTKAGPAMNTARKILLGTPRKRKRVDFTGKELDTETLDGPSLANVNWNDPKLSPEMKRYKVLHDMLVEQGQINRSTVADNIEMDNPSNNSWTLANNISGFMFHQGERFNRQITAIASYDLELDRIKAAKKGRSLTQADYIKAANQAMLDIDLTNSGAMTETAPRMAQGSVGSVALMYKRFGISMYALQFKMAKEALGIAKNAGVSAEVRSQARKQLIGIFATSGLMAGVQGLPLYGMVALLGNLFFLDEEDDDFDTVAARFLGEGLYSGALNQLTNLDIAPRIGMSNLVYRTLPNKTDQHAVMDALEFLGGPVYGVGKRAIDGMGLVGEGEVQRGIEKMLPSFAANPLKAYRYGTEGATTLRGDPITEDLGWWNVGAQAFGFVPASYTKQLELNAVEKRKEREKNEKRSELMREFYFDLVDQDEAAMADTLEEIVDFNERNPNFAMNANTISRSIAGHMRTTEEVKTTGGVTYARKNRHDVQRRNAEALGIDLDDLYGG